MLTVRHRCRALLVAKDAELRRAHEQLQLVQAEARDAAAAAAASASDAAAARAAAPPPLALAAGDGGVELPAGEAQLLAQARQQARHEAEVERWKSRATSLEARLKGAAEARRAWQLEQAELLERVDAQARQLALSDHAAQPVQIGYLKNTLLKYFEMGPDAFDEVFPLLSGFLEFSPEELERIRAARAAQQGSLGWLLGGASAPLPAARHAGGRHAGGRHAGGRAARRAAVRRAARRRRRVGRRRREGDRAGGAAQEAARGRRRPPRRDRGAAARQHRRARPDAIRCGRRAAEPGVGADLVYRAQ